MSESPTSSPPKFRPVAPPPSAPRPGNSRRLIEYEALPTRIYLQLSESFVLTCGSVHTKFTRDMPILSVTSAGIALRFLLDEVPGTLTGSPPTRRYDGFVWVNLNMNHQRYAAANRAARVGGAVVDRMSYSDLDDRFRRAAHHELTEAEAAELVEVVVQRALQLSGCQDYEVDSRVHEVMDRCDYRGTDRIGSLATQLGLSASRLSHLFSQEMGISFRQYALWRRTAEAWEDVALKPEKSLTEIAHDCGFADLAHMSHAFQAIYGFAPSVMRVAGRWKIFGSPERPGRRLPERWTREGSAV